MCNVLCRRILLDLNRADDSYVLEYALKGGEKRDKCRSGSCQ